MTNQAQFLSNMLVCVHSPVEAEAVEALFAGLVNRVESGAWILLLPAIYKSRQGGNHMAPIKMGISFHSYYCLTANVTTQIPSHNTQVFITLKH